MNQSPTITIVIPCLNEEQLVARNLNAILKQTIFPEAVIFGDNGSTDGSLEVAEIFQPKFLERGVDFQIIHVDPDPVLRQVAIRSKAFAMVQTDLIGTLDADSVICSDWVKVAKEEFAQDEQLVALAGYFEYTNTCWVEKMRFKLVFWSYNFKPNFIFWGSNGVFSKTAYDKIGGLKDFRQMIEEKKIKNIFDDNFISEKLKKMGKVKVSWRMRATGQRRGGLKREIEHGLEIPKVINYVKKNWSKIKEDAL
jgi:glycosyltransferase involved in cell wall biosynthesis